MNSDGGHMGNLIKMCPECYTRKDNKCKCEAPSGKYYYLTKWEYYTTYIKTFIQSVPTYVVGTCAVVSLVVVFALMILTYGTLLLLILLVNTLGVFVYGVFNIPTYSVRVLNKALAYDGTLFDHNFIKEVFVKKETVTSVLFNIAMFVLAIYIFSGCSITYIDDGKPEIVFKLKYGETVADVSTGPTTLVTPTLIQGKPQEIKND